MYREENQNVLESISPRESLILITYDSCHLIIVFVTIHIQFH